MTNPLLATPAFASKALLIRPVGFKKNTQTLRDNQFQSTTVTHEPQIAERALKEFENLRTQLTEFGVECFVFDPENSEATPDAVFPNNWISFHQESDSQEKEIFIYPMLAENRRQERSLEIVEAIKQKYGPYKLIDLSHLEERNQFLEGTGSLVLDRPRKKAYACLSERTSITALDEFKKISGFQCLSFEAFDLDQKPIYHTNVIMSLGLSCAIYAEDCIRDELERSLVRKHLRADFSSHILLDWDQVKNFCGNIILLSNQIGDRAWFMSTRAADSFTPAQKSILERDGKIVATNIESIETHGGGSVRCMIAEIF